MLPIENTIYQQLRFFQREYRAKPEELIILIGFKTFNEWARKVAQDSPELLADLNLPQPDGDLPGDHLL
ncbi:SGNH/GDSL hydrolase family protein [Antarctobacter heliothermus]|uniref:Uncharacterized protein n=1 Tax=Antarctobacter heliothermus TaxID=74033 RepID=A0A239MGV1_9RHOB|nr:SGNH/GDSL hydrolase family protein [Antarctobacter heliothermus]SNT41443.1 hypothetical protein SAMN04488078_11581 [Antarctobacter heliothermus]